MTFGSLFAGIGGFDLGFERAGMRCVWQVEIDPYCRRVLAKHWPNVPKWDDVKTFTGEGFERPDVICGGFPCQDISIAGKGAGIAEGTRSGLWSEYARIIRVLRPRFVVVENVAAIIARGIERVLGDLASLGFNAEWQVLPAAAFGAPHERERLFLVAHPCQGVGRCSVVFDRFDDLPRNQEWSSTKGIRSGRGWKRWLSETAIAVDGQISSRDFCGVDAGLSSELARIGAAGNSVIPAAAEWIGRRLMTLSDPRP